MPPPEGFVSIRYTVPWPEETIPLPTEGPFSEILDRVAVHDFESGYDAESSSVRASATLKFLGELAIEAPGLSGIVVVFNGAGGLTSLSLGATLSESLVEIRVLDLNVTLRLSTDAFRSGHFGEGRFVEEERLPSGERQPFSVAIENIDLQLSFGDSFHFDLLDAPAITLTPVAIADTGIVIEAESMSLHFSAAGDPPPAFDAAWRGVFIPRATIHLPEIIRGLPSGLTIENAGIGAGGFTGSVAFSWRRERGYLEAEFAGMGLRLYEIQLALEQNVPKRGAIESALKLPFFDDWMGLDLGFKPDGTFTAKIKSPEDSDDLVTLRQEDLFELTVESIGLEAKLESFNVIMSGRLKPLLADLDWPVLDVKALSIDEHGKVDIDGGWIDLPEQQTFDFHGFQITLSEMGFGSEEDAHAPAPAAGESRPKRQWLGVSGGIRLVEGLPLTASVDGLKVSWRPDIAGGDPKVTLEGIAISLEIPKTLSLTGQVEYEEMEDERFTGKIFRGSVDLNLMALRTRIGGELIIGHLTDGVTGESFDVAMVVLNAEFPTAIPLGATGAGLYGLVGLLGVNIAPDRHPSVANPAELESWLEWYKGEDPEAAPDVTSLTKWAPRGGHYAIGAGLTIGTVQDDGYTINAHALLAVLLPGPVIMLEGRANIIKTRSTSSTDQGVFYLLAVIDGNAGTLQLNIGVQFELASVIAIGGGAEAFFDFNDSSAWHLWLGQKDPESKRISADILSLFKVNAYLMVDAKSFATGARASFELHERYGPLSIDIAAGLSFDAAISWKPAQAEGRVELVGALALKVFGFGLGIALRLLLEAKAATPFWVHGLAHFAITLPFPLPDFDVTVEFTWEEPTPPDPVWPLLKGVELTHHLRAENHWTLSDDEAAAPVVPVDAVPVARFARPLAGRSYRQVPGGPEFLGYDHIADWTFTYACERTSLFARYPDGSERLVAEGPFSAGDITDVVPLDLSDESLIVGTDAQEPAWRLWTHERLPGASEYEREDRPVRDPACPPPIATGITCINFRNLADGQPFGREFRIGEWHLRCSDIPGVRVGLLQTTNLWIRFPRAMGRVEIRFKGDVAIRAFRDGEEVRIPGNPRNSGHSLQDWEVSIKNGIDALWMRAVGAVELQDFSLERICAIAREDTDAANEMRRNRATTARDSGRTGRLMLEPRTRYRLEVRTVVYKAHRTGEPNMHRQEAKSFYFETSDGPGANPLVEAERTALSNCHSEDADVPAPHAIFLGGDPLDTVALYVDHTRPGAEDDPFYFGLDPGLVFREAYFPEMYHHSWSHLMRVRDQNGRIVGESVARRSETNLPRMSPGEITWQAAEARGGCGQSGPSGGHTRDAMLIADGAALDLGPNRRYILELVLQGCFERVIHQFSLLTSHYPTPVAHLESGIVNDQQVVRTGVITSSLRDVSAASVSAVREAWQSLSHARAALQTTLAGGSLVAIHDALESARRSLGECDRVCQDAFTSITNGLGYAGYGERPPRTEVVALTAPDGVLLMIEAAEPVEWTRWSLSGIDDAGVSRTAVACWNVDRTRAILLPREGPISWARRSIRLEFRYLSDAADLPENRMNGVLYEPEPVSLPCNLGS